MSNVTIDQLKAQTFLGDVDKNIIDEREGEIAKEPLQLPVGLQDSTGPATPKGATYHIKKADIKTMATSVDLCYNDQRKTVSQTETQAGTEGATAPQEPMQLREDLVDLT